MQQKFKVLLIVCVLVVLTVLNSCSSKPDIPDDSDGVTVSATAVAPSQHTDSEKYRRKEKITYLSCLGSSEQIPALASLGNGELLAITWQFNGDGSSATTISLIDILEDKVIASKTLEGYFVFESLADSGFILKDLDCPEFCFFDSGLHLIRSYKPDSFWGKFSPDGKKYYQAISGKLYCRDVESGELSLIVPSGELAFSEDVTGISVDGTHVTLSYENYIDGLYDKTATVELNLFSGEIELLTYDVEFPSYSTQNLYARVYSPEEDAARFICVSLSGDSCTVIPISDYVIEHVSGSDYLIFVAISEEAYQETCIARLDENGRCRAAALNGENTKEFFCNFTYMPEEGLIACCSEKSGISTVCLIEPSLFDYSTEIACEQTDPPVLYDEQILADYRAQSTIPDCPVYLQTLRARADALEERYGIKIYMSGECRNMVYDIMYDCTDEFFDNDYEYRYIESALEELERGLAKYPEDFFRQFRRSTGDGGIRICLTAYIEDDFSVAYASNTGDWYNVVLDIRYNCEMNLSHELWHSTESFITAKDYSLLSYEKWQEFNPEGFDYSNEFRNNSDGISEYCYSYGGDWYFYDNYSKSSSLEDKARIMEIVMNPDIFPSEDFVSSVHIRNKLDCMSEAIRKTFDTSSWGDDVFWERFSP